MLDWFGTLAAGNALAVPAAIQLAERGFTTLPCVVGRENVELLKKAYVDVPRNSADRPLLSFILMVDDFCPDNGATRFVPGSHRWSETLEESMSDVRSPYEGEVLAFGEAGSLVVFDGSVWHGHTANQSNRPRRSVQGAYIPFHGHAATDFAAGMLPETRTRLCPLAHTLLALFTAQ